MFISLKYTIFPKKVILKTQTNHSHETSFVMRSHLILYKRRKITILNFMLFTVTFRLNKLIERRRSSFTLPFIKIDHEFLNKFD